MEIKLSVNGVEMKLGVEFAADIASSIPDLETNQKIFHELAQHNSASIRKQIAYKDKLSSDTVRLLLRDKNIEVLNNLLRSEAVKEIFNDEDFEYILSLDNEEAIENIISYISDFQELSDPNEALNTILKLENDYLTLQIANDYNTPKRILKKLVKHSDPDIANAAKSSLE